MTYRQAAEIVSRVLPISYAPLMSLEKRPEPPSRAGQRYAAYLILVAYGFDPTDFGLSHDDLPKGLTPDGVVSALRGSEQAIPASRCKVASDNVRYLAPRLEPRDLLRASGE